MSDEISAGYKVPEGDPQRGDPLHVCVDCRRVREFEDESHPDDRTSECGNCGDSWVLYHALEPSTSHEAREPDGILTERLGLLARGAHSESTARAHHATEAVLGLIRHEIGRSSVRGVDR